MEKSWLLFYENHSYTIPCIFSVSFVLFIVCFILVLFRMEIPFYDNEPSRNNVSLLIMPSFSFLLSNHLCRFFRGRKHTVVNNWCFQCN